MKKIAGIWFAVLFILAQSCASVPTKEYSVIIFRNTEGISGLEHRIFIDGKNRGIIKTGETKSFNVSNGYHTVMEEWRELPYEYTSKWSDTGITSLELSDEIIELEVRFTSSLRIISRKKIENPVPAQNPMPLNDMTISKSFDTLSQLIPNGSKIAILNITPNNDDGRYINEELMVKFVNSRKYIIVDRDTLATIRQEQQFQMAGEVSDDSAVSIGHFLGADVVITGSITGTGNQRRLRLRALDVKTAQVLAMSSENI